MIQAEAQQQKEGFHAGAAHGRGHNVRAACGKAKLTFHDLTAMLVPAANRRRQVAQTLTEKEETNNGGQ